LPIPLLFSVVVGTGSRVALASIFLSAGLGLLLLRYKNIAYKLVAIIVGFLIFQYSFDYVTQSDAMKRRITKTLEQQDLGGRKEIWEEILPLIDENAVFGVGLSGYEKHSIVTFGKISSPHNVILEILAYCGILGLLLFFVFFLKVVIISFKYYLINRNFLSLMLLIPVMGLFLSAQALDVKVVWVILAFASSKVFHLKKNKTFENSLLYR
jgi:O-antigen ligase